jgi:hypothetical protein
MKLFTTLSMAVALSALFSAGKLGATNLASEPVTIPFEFKVDTATMPAGRYCIEREFNGQAVSIVNLNTGRRVRMLRKSGTSSLDRLRLTFKATPDGHKLAKIS